MSKRNLFARNWRWGFAARVGRATCCFMLLISATATSQTSSSARPPGSDSLTGAARQEGIAAANGVSIVSQFAGGFLGGIGFGLGGVLLSSDRGRFVPGFLAISGVAVITTTLSGTTTHNHSIDEFRAAILPHSTQYDSLFADAFRNRVQSRRQRAALWGAFTGTALGVLSGAWLISRWLDT
jgi:predicted lipid-binding transport protein (Tim44 family)